MKANIDKDKRWFVVRTSIKCEEKAANNLRLSGFDVYLPRIRYEVKNKRSHAITQREKPMMLRYLFVGLPMEAERQHFGFVRACEGVEGFIGGKSFGGPPICVPHKLVESMFISEINMEFDDTRAARIQRKEEARTKKLTIEMKFGKGSVWYVKEGPFALFHTTVEEVTNRGQVEALVSIFGRMTTVTFDPGQLVEAA